MTIRLMSLVLKFLSAESAMAFICSEIIDAELSQTSAVALNGFLHDPPASILDRILDEVMNMALNAATSADVNLIV